MEWVELPSLPRSLGGQYVGSLGSNLIVAGGTWWEGSPWKNGKKHWEDTVYSLRPGDKGWRNLGKLPRGIAYGACVASQGALLLIGGQSDGSVSSQILELTLGSGGAKIKEITTMPLPAAWLCAAVMGDRLYLGSGGEGFPATTKAYRTFWSYNLKNPAEGWIELDPWPGSPRFLATMASTKDSLYLAGGADFENGKRVYRKDAFQYQRKTGWKQIADLPVPLQAGTAIGIGNQIAVFGGNDGSWAGRESDPSHPGFRREVFSHDPEAKSWKELGAMPMSLVTTGITRWQDMVVIAGGEDKPGSRSAKVIGWKAKA